MIAIKRNGITIGIEDWSPWKKLPVLTVRIENDNSTYKVASFNNKETAEWFIEIVEEFLEGMVEKNVRT